MLEKLLDILAQGWDMITPVFVVKEYEGGVLLRFGLYSRTLEGGLHWKIPLIDLHILTKTCITTMHLPPQTITTQDDKSVVAAAIVKYQVKDPRPFLLKIWDSPDVLADTTMGSIRSAINSRTYAELFSPTLEADILAKIRAEVNEYGFKIHKFTFTDLGKARTFRLMQPLPKDLSN